MAGAGNRPRNQSNEKFVKFTDLNGKFADFTGSLVRVEAKIKLNLGLLDFQLRFSKIFRLPQENQESFSIWFF